MVTEGEYNDANMGVTVIAVNGHIRAIWEANCSCRAAGTRRKARRGCGQH